MFINSKKIIQSYIVFRPTFDFRYNVVRKIKVVKRQRSIFFFLNRGPLTTVLVLLRRVFSLNEL